MASMMATAALSLDPESEMGDDAIGAREALRALLELRRSTLMPMMPRASSSGEASSSSGSPAASGAADGAFSSSRWEQAIVSEVQDLERRTSEAVSRAGHPSAKRAVALLARRDLLDLSLEGAADALDEKSSFETKNDKNPTLTSTSTSVAAASLFLRGLRSRASSLLDAWRLLLEDCESEAEGELSAAEGRARAAEARAEAAEAKLREVVLAAAKATATASPPPRPPPRPLPPLTDAIAAVTLVSPTKLKKLQIKELESEEATKKQKKNNSLSSISSCSSSSSKVAKAPHASRLPPTEAEARALLEAERAADGGEGEAFRMPPASEVETPLSVVVAAAVATKKAAATSKQQQQQQQQPPPLQRSSSSAGSLLLLGLPDSAGVGSSLATPGSPSLSLRALASVLDDIFACKSRADERARQAGNTRPSLSAFLDSYLLARFGGAAFGAVAREWRQAIERASSAAHRALFSEEEGGKGGGEAATGASLTSTSSSSAALVEAAAFWSILKNRIDEEWWLEAARLREALAEELGSCCATGANNSGAATPVAASASAAGATATAAATSAPSSPLSAARRGGVAAAAVANALLRANSSSSLSRSPSSSLLPAFVEKSVWLRAIEAALPTRALARDAARLVEENLNSIFSSSASSAAAPRSLVLSCALRASLNQRIGRLVPAADAFAAAARAEAEEVSGGGGRENGSNNSSSSSSSSSLRPRAFRSFCRALAPSMRARDVAALLDALVPSSDGGESDGAAVSWSTAASALAAELEREERAEEEEGEEVVV